MRRPSTWTFHEVKFSEPRRRADVVYDVDGDGDNDVVTSKAAHAYGLAWFENVGTATTATITFKEHTIMGEKPEENEYGVAFSQLHALALADMDGDGVQDIVTGKRYWAHASTTRARSIRPCCTGSRRCATDGKVRFIPHQIDNNSGVGTQVVAGDLNGDKWPDIVVGNKKGTFVFMHRGGGSRSRRSGRRPSRCRRRRTSARPQAEQAAAQPMTDGFRATAADGRVLNLDFERAT